MALELVRLRRRENVGIATPSHKELCLTSRIFDSAVGVSDTTDRTAQVGQICCDWYY